MFFSLIHFVSVALLLLIYTASITVQEVVDLTSENCNTDVLSTRQNKDVQLILRRNESGNVSDIDGCYYIVKLEYSTYMQSRIEVTVSLESSLDCEYKVEIYPGDPITNRNIETLDCDSNPSWTGHFPTRAIFLRYVRSVVNTTTYIDNINTRFDKIMTNITFGPCWSCYRTPTIYGIPKKKLTDYCGRDVCAGGRDIELLYKFPNYITYGRCPPCRSIAFDVKDSAQICFKTHQYMFVWGTNVCNAKVKIDNNSVLILKDSLQKKWCLPWNLKDKRVEFTFGDDSSWGCRATVRCNVEIQVIPENKNTYICPIPTPKPKEWSSWTDDFDDTDWNSPSDDDDDESENQTLIIALIVSCTLIVMCGCFCKYKCKRSRNSEDSEPRQVLNMHYMQNSIYQRKADQPTASESSDEGPDISENIRDVRRFPDIETWAASFANDNSETVHDQQLQETMQDNSDLDSHPLASLSENIDDQEIDPPPSYEEVCRHYQPS
ncbi:uncharacterized protein LOC143083536 isoform X1 [Mytilus galloprovincialis]|uniref:uncharacterized protein LOC143083536 isoform X1 n=2 Tax=Mytilus galloprovincialis TaxID=29158 RepID=UPI003F7B44C0